MWSLSWPPWGAKWPKSCKKKPRRFPASFRQESKATREAISNRSANRLPRFRRTCRSTHGSRRKPAGYLRDSRPWRSSSYRSANLPVGIFRVAKIPTGKWARRLTNTGSHTRADDCSPRDKILNRLPEVFQSYFAARVHFLWTEIHKDAIINSLYFLYVSCPLRLWAKVLKPRH